MKLESTSNDRPARIGEFELLDECLADGPFHSYLARQQQLERLVFLKVVPSTAPEAERLAVLLFREAEATAQFDHPGVLRVVESGTADGQAYLALSYVDGQTLAERLRIGPIPERLAAEYARQLAETLFVIQSSGQFHANLRPEYVHIGRDGQVRLNGFGTFDRLGDLSGYLAPERLANAVGSIDARTDIYGLGALLYAMLTGRTPLRADNDETLAHKIRKVNPRPPSEVRPGIDRDIEAICLQCLNKNALRRYGPDRPLTQLIADLRRFLNRRPVSVRSVGAWERFRIAMEKQQRLFTCVLFVAVGLTATLAWDRYRTRRAWQVVAQSEAPALDRNRALAYWQRQVTVRPHDPETAAAAALAHIRANQPRTAMQLLPIELQANHSERKDDAPVIHYRGRRSRWQGVQLLVWALAALEMGQVEHARLAFDRARTESDVNQPPIAATLAAEIKRRLPNSGS